MGYDRIRFYDGEKRESTLVSADKRSHDALVSWKTQSFLRHLGHRVQLVVDANKPAGLSAEAIKNGAAPVELPPKVLNNDPVLQRQASWEPLLEVQPPLNPDTIKPFLAYLAVTCEPSDAGPLYLDHRGEHDGCLIDFSEGVATCESKKQPLAQTPEAIAIQNFTPYPGLLKSGYEA